MSAPVLGRLLLVEDDESLALALGEGLRRAGYDALVLSDGTDIARLVEGCHLDLALLDVSLPAGPDGFDLARWVRATLGIPVLFVTASDALADRLIGFEAGADDYVVKPFALAELLARIRVVLRRTGRLTSPVVEVRDLVIDEYERSVTRSGRSISVTPTEFNLLLVLARHAGEVLSKGQLLSSVWGFSEYDANLVEVHVSALRRKVEGQGPPLIRTERGRGYVLVP